MVGCVATVVRSLVPLWSRGRIEAAEEVPTRLVERLEPVRIQRGDEGGEVQLRPQGEEEEEVEVSGQVEIDTACKCRWRPRRNRASILVQKGGRLLWTRKAPGEGCWVKRDAGEAAQRVFKSSRQSALGCVSLHCDARCSEPRL